MSWVRAPAGGILQLVKLATSTFLTQEAATPNVELRVPKFIVGM